MRTVIGEALRLRLETAHVRYSEWSRRPRYALDWHYESQSYLFVGFPPLALIVGGISILVGANPNASRLLGLASLLAGGMLAIPLVVYTRRPSLPHHKRWYRDVATDAEAAAASKAVAKPRRYAEGG